MLQARREPAAACSNSDRTTTPFPSRTVHATDLQSNPPLPSQLRRRCPVSAPTMRREELCAPLDPGTRTRVLFWRLCFATSDGISSVASLLFLVVWHSRADGDWVCAWDGRLLQPLEHAARPHYDKCQLTPFARMYVSPIRACDRCRVKLEMSAVQSRRLEVYLVKVEQQLQGRSNRHPGAGRLQGAC